MQYIIPADREMLTAMLGTTDLPDGFEVEYQAQVRLFHRSGMSGPIGAAMLVNLCRMFDLSAPVYQPPTQIDWLAVEKNTWIIVRDKAVRFQSMVSAGTLSYLVPGESVAMEASLKDCSLHPNPPEDEPVDTRTEKQKLASV